VVFLLLPVSYYLRDQASAFAWPTLIGIIVVGFAGLLLAPRAGFPDMWDERVANTRRFVLPAVDGIVYGLITIFALDLLNPSDVHIAFPASVLFYTYGGIFLEIREAALVELHEPVEPDTRQIEYQSLVASAIAALPDGERHVTVLFYVMGHTQQEIARLLRLKSGTVAKRLHSARLRIRRWLPPSVRSEFLRVAPSRTFGERVRFGIFDEYVGEYRFALRPDLVVSIVREAQSLVSDCNGQRNILASRDDESLVTSSYDGEGRFGRNGRGDVTHFIYYEFGKRLGVAWKAESAR